MTRKISKINSPIKAQIVDELHKPARINFRRRRVIVKGLDDLHQADLVEMIPYSKVNKGYRYILVIIDVFSKYVWLEPVKTKTSTEVARATEKILSESGRIPKNLQTDQGKEFFNKDFQTLMNKYKINHYSTFSTKKACVVERVNRTLKSIMWKTFSLQGSYKWLSLLSQVSHTYNHRKHSTIGKKPADVNKSNEQEILNRAYNHIKMTNLSNVKFKVGDPVRISKYRSIFEKGYTPNWTNEIFTIDQVKLTNPITYLLKDASNQPIRGCFYDLELQKVKYPDTYLVERVIKRKPGKVYVKWLGFSNQHNSWIDAKNIA